MLSRTWSRGGCRKTNRLVWLIPVVLLLGTGAAMKAQNFSRSAFRMKSFSAVAVYANGAATNPAQVIVQAEFKRHLYNQENTAEAEETREPLNIAFDLLAAPSTQTTVATGGGVTVTDAQLAALLRKRSENAAGL